MTEFDPFLAINSINKFDDAITNQALTIEKDDIHGLYLTLKSFNNLNCKNYIETHTDT